jgi:hypothetical protein
MNRAGLVIQLGEISPEALRTRAALDALCVRFDLAPYVQSVRLRIEKGAQPRLRPIATLGTASSGDPHLLLAEFLSLQMEALLAGRPEPAAAAAAALATRFPELRAAMGAAAPSDPLAPYRALAVAALELAALSRLLGAEEGGEIVRAHDAQRPLYRFLLRNEKAVGDVMTAAGLRLPESGKDAE